MHIVEKRYKHLMSEMCRRRLSAEEVRNLRESAQWLEGRAWKRARLLNLMYLARSTYDWGWMMELNGQYENFMRRNF